MQVLDEFAPTVIEYMSVPQSTQDTVATREYLPSGQVTQVEDPAVGATAPDTQLMQEVGPNAFEYFPALQIVQSTTKDALTLYFPIAHEMHSYPSNGLVYPA
jgi:hypothetical protein